MYNEKPNYLFNTMKQYLYMGERYDLADSVPDL